MAQPLPMSLELPTPCLAHAPGLAGPRPATDAAPPRGCAWFESSRELLQGTRVTEHQGFDGLAGELPLAWLLAGY